MNDLDKEWSDFLLKQTEEYTDDKNEIKDVNEDDDIPVIENNRDTPLCDELYISTKTKVLFLNIPIDIHTIFWKIPIIEYWKPISGIVKKQIKIVSKNMEEYQEYKKKLEHIPYYRETIIKQIDNPESRRIKFKDERKLTVGLSKKDVINQRGKVTNAFYNCFALIYRIKNNNNEFIEIHVKVFNTGKLEIPGILSVEIFNKIKENILSTLQPFINTKLEFIEQTTDDNILINSNFNCNFFINREKLFNIIRSEKYNIECAYDPCSYPGVKCKYYFNNTISFNDINQNGLISVEDRNMKMNELRDNKKYTEVSFMIFRTGSCIIVGNCSENILKHVYHYVKNMLLNEYHKIYVNNDITPNKNKATKVISKFIQVSKEYFQKYIQP